VTDNAAIERVLVTGATGFVGRAVVRELLARGVTPVCLVRSDRKLLRQHPDVSADRLAPVMGSLSDVAVLDEAAASCQAVIHLVGIIIERRLKGQTFRGVHVRGTRNVVDAAKHAGIRRCLHMSALGARTQAATAYLRTKWEAEEYVRESGLDWTIFRPSLIHGPQGEFMRLMKCFVAGMIPPVMPYFGSGRSRIQPVFVKDVAFCFVESLFRPETILKTFELGGPRAYTWIELYNACRTLIPGARRWKPMVSQPVPVAKTLAVLSAPVLAVAESIVPSLGLFRFDRGQVTMSQEDNICDPTAAEQAFGIRMRDFEEELASYADQIR
jgi:uncharacterized protein YbjT (DUF2867 family)